jgi:hypothetical protein
MFRNNSNNVQTMFRHSSEKVPKQVQTQLINNPENISKHDTLAAEDPKQRSFGDLQ